MEDLGGDEVAAAALRGDDDGLLGPLGGHGAGRDEGGGGGRTGPGGARAAAVLVVAWLRVLPHGGEEAKATGARRWGRPAWARGLRPRRVVLVPRVTATAE
jgi:hypothetical protein